MTRRTEAQRKGNILSGEYSTKNRLRKHTNFNFCCDDGDITIDDFIKSLKQNDIQFIMLKNLVKPLLYIVE
jgi:hypothetical protein